MLHRSIERMPAGGGEPCDRAAFTFVWTIQNVSHCPQFTGSCLSSAEFLTFDASWVFELYPKGRGGIDIECSLRLTEAYADVVVDCVVCMCSITGERLGVSKKRSVVFSHLSSEPHSMLFDRLVTVRLPQDTLVVHCHLSRSGVDRTGIPVHCHQLTPIEVQKLTFLWNIERFSALPLKDEREYRLPPVERGCPTLAFHMTLDGKTLAAAALRIWIVCEGARVPTLVKCSVSIQGPDDASVKVMTGEHWVLDDKDERLFSHFVRRAEVMADPETYLPDGSLALQFEVVLSIECNVMQVVYNQPASFALPSFRDRPVTMTVAPDMGAPHTLSSDLGRLLKGGAMSDFELSSGGRAFPVHRLLLGARSPVFRNMFQNDFREKREDSLRIPDLDPDTLHRMLRYVYTDAVPDMSWQDAERLYYAADKYELLDLRRRCSIQIGERLDPSNALEVLALADRHGDPDLKRAVQGLLYHRGAATLDSEEWGLLEDKDPRLAAETLRGIFCEEVFAPMRRGPTRCNRQGEFTFVWTIENFMYYDKMLAENRPTYPASGDLFAFGETWVLCLVPDRRNRSVVDIVLRMTEESPGTAVVDCEMCMVTTRGDRLGVMKAEDLGPMGQRFHFDKDICSNLPKDTLIIHCHLWSGDRNGTVHCHQVSRVNMQKRTFRWNIRDFTSLSLEDKRVFRLDPVESGCPALEFKVSLEGPTVQDAKVRFQISFESVIPSMFYACRIAGVDRDGNELEDCLTDEQWVDGDETITLANFLSRSQLVSDRTSCLPGDVLTLDCEVTLSGHKQGVEQVIYGLSTPAAVDLFHEQLPPHRRVPARGAPHTLTSDLLMLYEDGAPYDWDIVCDGRSFSVHDLMMRARSPVFMKSEQMALDMFPEHLDVLLRYVYTDALPDMSWQDALYLFAAADDYKLLHLRRWCCVRFGLSFEELSPDYGLDLPRVEFQSMSEAAQRDEKNIWKMLWKPN